jgi:hypothetical protein
MSEASTSSPTALDEWTFPILLGISQVGASEILGQMISAATVSRDSMGVITSVERGEIGGLIYFPPSGDSFIDGFVQLVHFGLVLLIAGVAGSALKCPQQIKRMSITFFAVLAVPLLASKFAYLGIVQFNPYGTIIHVAYLGLFAFAAHLAAVAAASRFSTKSNRS